MENKTNPPDFATAPPSRPVGIVDGDGPWDSLEGPVIAALLETFGCHVLILDSHLQLVAADPGALPALGLQTGNAGTDILPAQAQAHFASRGYRLCGPPVPLGTQGHHLWTFRKVRNLERREEAAPDRAQPDPPQVEGKSGTILVVDDSPMVRRLLKAVLSKDYTVVLAEDGEQAVSMAAELLPDLILLDALMPVMDGFSACRALKADPRTRDISVIFLTALQGDVDEVKALEAGAIDFLPKPVNAATVLARVRNHIDLKTSKDKLRDLAVKDGLTSLFNRRQFDQVLAQEWQRSRREGKPLSLILGDVDCFKKYNDEYGHVAGDACLKAVAGVMKAALRRPADLAARYGGEEFVCLLPDTDEIGARTVALEIMRSLAELHLPHRRSEVGPEVTLSLGVATTYSNLEGSCNLLVEEADRRMYEAKRKAKARNLRAGGAD